MKSAEIQPTQISKINTFLQLVLMGSTLASPTFHSFGPLLPFLQGMVGVTTIWSGASYFYDKSVIKLARQPGRFRLKFLTKRNRKDVK